MFDRRAPRQMTKYLGCLTILATSVGTPESKVFGQSPRSRTVKVEMVERQRLDYPHGPDQQLLIALPERKEAILFQNRHLFRSSLAASADLQRFFPSLLRKSDEWEFIMVLSISASRTGQRLLLGTSMGDTLGSKREIWTVFADGRGLLKLAESRRLGHDRKPCHRLVQADDGTPGMEGTPWCIDYFKPSLSPNGKTVAVIQAETLWTDNEPLTRYFLTVIDSEGSAPRRRVEVGSGQWSHAWSARSERLFFFRYLPGERPLCRVVTVDVESSEIVSIGIADKAGCPTDTELKSSDANHNLYFYDSRSLVELDSQDGERRRVTTVQLEDWNLSPDGKRMLGTHRGFPTVVELDTGEAAYLSDNDSSGQNVSLLRLRVDRTTGASRTHKTQAQSVRGLGWLDDQRIICLIGDGTDQEIGVLRLQE